jgi:glutamate/tyrosine decarboxylase-like PLP-dependent enzyme
MDVPNHLTFRLMEPSLEALRQACSAPLSHPDLETLRNCCTQLTDWVLRDFAALPGGPIGRTASRAEMEARLREPPPEEGQPFADVLFQFQERVAPYTMRPNHPRFLAFIPGAPSFVSVLGDWLCAGTNYFAGVWLEAAGPAQVELLVLDWFKEFLGYPAESCGVLTGGGSEANLTALVVARERLTDADRARAVLYETEHRHWSIDRAAKIIGLRPDQVRPVPADKHFRLLPAALEAAVAEDTRGGRLPWLAVANAGATNTGTVDPLEQLADVCRDRGLWLHVDAAYGWPGALTRQGRAMLAGIQRADSISLDPHKWFGQTFEAGCVLVRAGRLLHDTFALRPEYMLDVVPAADEVNFADHGLALTRRFRALKIWLSLKVLGLRWFRELVDRCCHLADYAQALLQRAGSFEILSPRQLSILCFRYAPPVTGTAAASSQEVDALNLALSEELRLSGRAFLSTTRLDGRVALRLCFVNWRTTAGDVEEIISLLHTLGGKLARNR